MAVVWRLCRYRHRRHTCASHLVMAGVDIATVREIMRHKSIEMTLRYAHLSPSHKKAAVDALARIIHEASTAAAQTGMFTALRSVGFLDVLSSTPAESSRRAPCIHARLHRLATNLHE
jgi:Phage integrase family